MSGFPPTRLSAVRAASSADPETRRRGFEALVGAYWRAVYKYLRWEARASPEDAEDLTQGFFARAFEKGFFDGYDPARSRFRTFLRVCLDRYVANEREAARALQRGGSRCASPSRGQGSGRSDEQDDRARGQPGFRLPDRVAA